MNIVWFVGPLAAYVVAVLAIGIAATRRASTSPEAYFLAGRTLGPLVLFMALFGTNCTAFVLVGIPGRAYHDGVGVFSVNAPIIALGVPLTFWFVGRPARLMAERLGALTPAELFRKRFASRRVGGIMFVVYLVYTLPYMVTAVKGAAVTLHSAADVPLWLGGLSVTAVALVYTALGGMRATAWTNVLQGTLFLAFVVLAFFGIADALGGLTAAAQHVMQHDPRLLQVGSGPLFTPGGWTSWSLAIALCVIGFPHMLVRLMAGRDDAALRTVIRLYPIALVLLWIPVVMIGVWGAAAFPGLDGRASDRIFALMTSTYLPPALAATGFLAVLAAVMSTLDAQILTLSSMFVRDIFDRNESTTDRRDVALGRGFAVLIAIAVYILALTWGASVFAIAALAFSGYVTLFPTLLLGLNWKRCTSNGAIASIVSANAVLLSLTAAGWHPGGFMPSFWALVIGTVVLVAVSACTSPSETEVLDRAFG